MAARSRIFINSRRKLRINLNSEHGPCDYGVRCDVSRELKATLLDEVMLVKKVISFDLKDKSYSGRRIW